MISLSSYSICLELKSCPVASEEECWKEITLTTVYCHTFSYYDFKHCVVHIALSYH